MPPCRRRRAAERTARRARRLQTRPPLASRPAQRRDAHLAGQAARASGTPARAARRRAPSERWAEAARRAADALVKLWERNKQLGQFVDIESGELIVGGSTSAGLAPAGLALAAAQLKQPRYLAIAKAIGEHYYERFVRVGLTCGGPGDVLQAPDSQSAAALLDSFMTLFEATRDRVWIDRARAAAHLLASWVISYDAPAAGSGVRRVAGARDRRRVLERRQRARLARLRAVVGRRAAAPLPRDRRRHAARAAARHRPQPGSVSAGVTDGGGRSPRLTTRLRARRPRALARRPATARPGGRRVRRHRAAVVHGGARHLRPRRHAASCSCSITSRRASRSGRAGGWCWRSRTRRGWTRRSASCRRRRMAPPSRCARAPCWMRRPRSLPAGGDGSGERAAAVERPLSPTLSPCARERESEGASAVLLVFGACPRPLLC